MKNLLLRSSLLFTLLLCVLIDSVHPVPLPRRSTSRTVAVPSRSRSRPGASDKTEIGNHFEGDILLKEGEKPYGYRKRRETILSSSGQEAQMMSTDAEYTHIWPNKTVYYTFQTLLAENYRSKFQAAVDIWAASTCMKFELAGPEQSNYIMFEKSDELGCSSYVGMKEGSQIVSMNDYCLSVGHAIHEIGHAIGLWHEHSRPDRDEYIEVVYDNIISTEQNNFGILSPEKFALVPDVGYDTESIMHYGPYAFSDDSNGPAKRTIELRPNAPLDYKHCSNLLAMGQRDELSYLDKLRANKLYSCQAHVTQLEAEGRTCITPETTPTPTTTLPTKTMPSPTTTQPTVPTPAVKRLASGSTITIRLDNEETYEEGVRCDNLCKTSRCRTLGGTDTCDLIAYQFQMVSMDNPDAKKIRSGATVAFRSKNSPTLWLDCSNSESACSISTCTRNDADTSGNGSFVTTCDNHFFKIFGVGRREGRLLNSNHSINLRHEYNDSYLNCDLNSKCTLSDTDKGAFRFKIKDE